jgi:hypothetical protein
MDQMKRLLPILIVLLSLPLSSLKNVEFGVPGVTITSAESDPTNSSPFSVTITFTEEVSGFVEGDITVTNGTAGNLSTSDNIVFTADITPTLEGQVDVDIAAAVASSVSTSDGNTAATTFSIEYDNTNPDVTITSTESDPTSTSPFSITVTFDEPVNGFDPGTESRLMNL